jgi:soluble lytic murein transglycosylase
VAVAAPAVLADGELYGYVSSSGIVHVTNVPTDQRFGEIILNPRYHPAVSDHELEEAVIRYAREYRLSPALLLAVMKAESSFDPTVISKAGAVGLMQLISETVIRHGVRNIFGTFWIVFTAIFGWHSRPTTLERRKSTGIGRFPRSKKPSHM